MSTLRHLADRTVTRLALRAPERLWVHYCFALAIIFCLILATHLLNSNVTSHSVKALSDIKKSNAQAQLAQEIVLQSEQLIGSPVSEFGSFNKAVMQFENTHAELLSTEGRSDALNAHFFFKDRPLHEKVREFLSLAKLITTGAADLREEAQLRLAALYGSGGLHRDLTTTATIFAEQMEQASADFASVQLAMLAASAIVLLGEAFFIFLPAQRSVQSNIREMQRKAQELRRSQEKLTQMNNRLEHIAKHHHLTELPNRTALTEFLAKAMGEGDAREWSLLMVGLDDFKSVNETIGHDYGDALLIAVSRALKSCVDDENMVAHVGGDEFVVISGEPMVHLVQRVTKSFEEPFTIKGRRIPINASIGHLQIGDGTRRPLDILADAEFALHVAKNAGGNTAKAFTQDLRDDLGLMHKLQLELTDAIRNGEIEPWFQPQVRLSDGRLHGAEVLARWRHPTRGLLTPDAFLPAAERAGLMVELDHAIWKSAMEQALLWQKDDIWRPSISLNAAPDTISDPHLLERFLLSLRRSGLDVDQVVLEVLETTLISGKDDVAAINIDSLADCGIALELDDFGTGYASLARITQLPLSGIKLDRSLVSPLPDQAADSVVRAILALATELGLHVVAEGVEVNEQAAHLNDRGCGIGQGYGFGKPMPPSEFTSWLAAHAKTPVYAAPDVARSA